MRPVGEGKMDEKDMLRALSMRKGGAAQRTWRCPDEVRLAAYADAMLAEAHRRRVHDHIADCDYCLDQVDFLLRGRTSEVAGGLPEAVVVQARELPYFKPKVSWTPGLGWGVATAATASLVLGAALWVAEPEMGHPPSHLPSPPPAPTVSPLPSPPAAPPAPAVRSRTQPVLLPELVFPQEGSTLARGEVEFRWRRIESSLFYEILVVSDDGKLVWEERVEAASTRVPADVQLEAGQVYFAWVRAHLPEGKTLKSSAVSFAVREDNR